MVSEKRFDRKMFWPKKSFVEKIFRRKKFWFKKSWRNTPKKMLVKIFCRNTFGPNNLWSNKSFLGKIFCRKTFLAKKSLSEKVFRPKTFSGKVFWITFLENLFGGWPWNFRFPTFSVSIETCFLNNSWSKS